VLDAAPSGRQHTLHGKAERNGDRLQDDAVDYTQLLKLNLNDTEDGK